MLHLFHISLTPSAIYVLSSDVDSRVYDKLASLSYERIFTQTKAYLEALVEAILLLTMGNRARYTLVVVFLTIYGFLEALTRGGFWVLE